MGRLRSLKQMPGKTRILYVIDALQFGGGERVFSQIIGSLSPEKYDIYLACQPNDHFYDAIPMDRVAVIPLDFTRRINIGLLFSLGKIIKNNAIHIVHGQGARAEFYARVANRLAGGNIYISTIAMPVEGFDIPFMQKRLFRIFDRFSEKYVDHFIVVSDALKNMLTVKRRIDPQKVFRIFNGIDLSHYQPTLQHGGLRKEYGISENATLIGAIGRMVWQKGFEYFIRAIPEIKRSIPNLKIMLVGEGPLKEKFERLAKSLGVEDHVLFTGFQNDIRKVLSGLDMLVVPSLSEGLPMIILEAMAMEIPVIATRIPGIAEEVIDGRTGILIPPKDAAAISRSIIHLSENKNLSNRIRKAAKHRVERMFDQKTMIEETERLYRLHNHSEAPCSEKTV